MIRIRSFLITCIFLLVATHFLVAQTGNYMAELTRPDSLPIRFNLDILRSAMGETWVIRNGAERITLTDNRKKGDSIFVELPFYESAIRVLFSEGAYTGLWTKGTTTKPLVLPLRIGRGTVKYPVTRNAKTGNITGRWEVTFVRPNGTSRPAVAEFKQVGSTVKGTFLTPSGDYRYLDGVLNGDSLQLSCFDGAHAYYFGARLMPDGSLQSGVWASGATYRETWTARRNKTASIDENIAAMQLRAGEESIGFRFPDLDSQMVSLKDPRFQGKVVLVQIMGSWCPNCMDETAFLSDYYRNNRTRGVEIIGLAYEYTADFSRASKSLRKFKDKFRVEYPMLISGVTSVDSLKTEKTLPQLTPIKAFPTTIFIGRDGRVKKIHAGFNGPGTGDYYETFKKDFAETMEKLLKEEGH